MWIWAVILSLLVIIIGASFIWKANVISNTMYKQYMRSIVITFSPVWAYEKNMLKSDDFFAMVNSGNSLYEDISNIDYINYLEDCNFIMGRKHGISN